jgi:hypothetical protein
MAAEPADLADSQPFSPSDFLNLPPTPRLDLDCPVLHLLDDDDDLVLPFISPMLMEEEMDGLFEQYHPDHPALLQAQQPFADILSDAAASTTATKSSGSANSNYDAAAGTGSLPLKFERVSWPTAHDTLTSIDGRGGSSSPLRLGWARRLRPPSDDNKATRQGSCLENLAT